MRCDALGQRSWFAAGPRGPNRASKKKWVATLPPISFLCLLAEAVRLRSRDAQRFVYGPQFGEPAYWPNHRCHVSLARSVSDFEACCATGASPVVAGLPSADGSPTVRTTEDVVAGGPTAPDFVAGSVVTAFGDVGAVAAVVVAGGD